MFRTLQLVIVFWSSLIVCQVLSGNFPLDAEESAKIRKTVHSLSDAGELNDLLIYLNKLEEKYNTLLLDEVTPSLYSYKGVALYNKLKVDEAIDSFKTAVSVFPDDVRAWINLGELQVQTFKLDQAIQSFSTAFAKGDFSALSRMLSTKGWSVDWQDFEFYVAEIEKRVKECEFNITDCAIDSVGGALYSDDVGVGQRKVASKAPNARSSSALIAENEKAQIWSKKEVKGVNNKKKEKNKRRRLKIGLISADFGVHPVSSLLRGFVQFLDKNRVELFCFSLKEEMSWWGTNITSEAEHSVFLLGLNTFDAAKKIARYGIEVLIDLNGHTMHSGLPIMAHRPAPVQYSFLGLPTTTAATFIDYYIADFVALPPEYRDHFSEKLVLMENCYIVNDFAQVQGDIPLFSGENRAPRSLMGMKPRRRSGSNSSLDWEELLFATLSNSQKMDPQVFHVWMNILRVFPSAKMVFTEYMGKEVYFPHIRNQSKYFGISPDRVFSVPQTPWLDHIFVKTGLDLVLDTPTKNGHTTGLDGIWAGVPTISLAGRRSMSARAAESIAVTLRSELGMGYSLKEYEDLAIALADRTRVLVREKGLNSEKTSENDELQRVMRKGEERLRKWRKHVEQQRLASPLFDTRGWTKNFENILEASWEAAHITREKSLIDSWVNASGEKHGRGEPVSLFHVFAARVNKDELKKIVRNQQFSSLSMVFKPELAEMGQKEREKEYKTTLKKMQKSNSKGKNKTIPESKGKISPASDRNPKIHFETDEDLESIKEELDPIPDYVFDGRMILINIGGIFPVPGWLNVNSQPVSFNRSDVKVDIIRKMDNLIGFPNDSVSVIYSSHTLEHANINSLEPTLQEWNRVLTPGGVLAVSVPDLENLARMYLDNSFSLKDRWHVTQMIYGGQSDKYDFHHVGFNEELLTYLLQKANFCEIKRVRLFGLPMNDTSDREFNGYWISLNMVAKVCESAKPREKGEDGKDRVEINLSDTYPYDGSHRVY